MRRASLSRWSSSPSSWPSSTWRAGAKLTDEKKAKKRGEFFAFSRTAFGIVKTRTDGQRLLVYTDSGNVKMKEAYAYELDQTGMPQPAPVHRA